MLPRLAFVLRPACALWCCTWLCVQAQTASMGVMQAYEAARLNDPVYRAAQAEYEVGQQHQHLGRAGLLPVISASISAHRNQADITDALGNTQGRSYNSSSAQIQLRQPLFDREGRAAYRQGTARSLASEARFAARQQDLIVRVFDAYAAANHAQEQVRLAQVQLDALAEQQRANEQLLAKGEGTRTEVLETRALYQMSQAQLIEAQNTLALAHNKLSAITGRPVHTLDRLAAGFHVDPSPTRSLDQWRELALQNSGELRSLRQELVATSEEIRRVEAGHYPRLDLVASIGRNESDTVTTITQRSRVHSVGVQLNVPIYAGGAVTAQGRQAVARHAQALAELDARTLDTLVEVNRQFQLQQSAALRAQALVKAVESNRVLIEATRKSVGGGVRTNLDVLNALERLSQSERDLASARHTHLLAGLQLRSHAGVLEEADLRQVASRFETPR